MGYSRYLLVCSLLLLFTCCSAQDMNRPRYKRTSRAPLILDKTKERTFNIKVNALGWMLKSANITLEKAFNRYSSWEITPKIVGVGLFDAYNEVGVAISGGVKVKLGYLFNEKYYKADHVLDGAYLRYGLGYGYTKDQRWSRLGTITRTQNVIHTGFDLGNQWIFKNAYSLDIYYGIHTHGYVLKDELNGAIIMTGYDDGHYYLGDIVGNGAISYSFGIRFGLLFDKFGKYSLK